MHSHIESRTDKNIAKSFYILTFTAFCFIILTKLILNPNLTPGLLLLLLLL